MPGIVGSKRVGLLCVVYRVCLPSCHPILGYWTGQKWQEVMLMTSRGPAVISILVMRSEYEQKICNNIYYVRHTSYLSRVVISLVFVTEKNIFPGLKFTICHYLSCTVLLTLLIIVECSSNRVKYDPSRWSLHIMQHSGSSAWQVSGS